MRTYPSRDREKTIRPTATMIDDRWMARHRDARARAEARTRRATRATTTMDDFDAVFGFEISRAIDATPTGTMMPTGPMMLLNGPFDARASKSSAPASAAPAAAREDVEREAAMKAAARRERERLRSARRRRAQTEAQRERERLRSRRRREETTNEQREKEARAKTRRRASARQRKETVEAAATLAAAIGDASARRTRDSAEKRVEES